MKNIAYKELDLNIKHQLGDVKEPFVICYQYDETTFIGMIVLPKVFGECLR